MKDLSCIRALAIEPELLLVSEGHPLVERRFLVALQREVEDRIGPDASQLALLQIGFANGLRDAQRALERAEAASTETAMPGLAMRFVTTRGGETPGAIELAGVWPEGTEALVCRERNGRTSGCRCHLSAGYTSGWLSGLYDADILAMETDCEAGGADACRFVAREASVWSGDDAERLLGALPFDTFRALVQGEPAPVSDDPDGAPGELPESGASVVHIWGPVMVVPFTGPDEALSAIELIGRDPAAREVSVIVLDLSSVTLDEGYGALALERVIETAELWGAETILTEVSQLSEPIVADLARPPLLVLKSVEESIATAFQIARSQRVEL